MSHLRTLTWVGVAIVLFLVGLLVAGFVLVRFGAVTLPLLLLMGLAYGWMLWAYLHYRIGRQDEFLQLLIVTAEAGAPLAPALGAYLRDRPHGAWREFWDVPLLFVVPGFVWLRGGFDRKVARFAQLIEMGLPLHEALRTTPGLTPRATVLAAAVGESTGQLARCLRGSTQGRLAPVWLAVLPRLLYPPALLVFVTVVGGFWLTYLAPKMVRICRDMGVALPALTQGMMDVGDFLSNHGPAVGPAVAGVVALLILLIVSPTARWFCPGLGGLQRLSVRSWVLQMLAVLLEGGRPVPEALAVLAGPGSMGWLVRRRLRRAHAAVSGGEPLADSLCRAGLLPPRAAALVRAAEAARNLPWALAELGEQLAGRAARRARRTSLLLFTTAVVAVGVLIAVLVLGMFLPLVTLITELA
jgi:general secretion pathway protein F